MSKTNKKIDCVDVENIFNKIPDEALLIDKNFKIIKASDSALLFCGLPKEKVVGKNCYDVVKSSFCDVYKRTSKCPLNRIIKNKEERIEYETCKKNKNDKEKFYIATAVPYKNLKGNIAGIIEEFKDITIRKTGEQKTKKEKELYKNLVNHIANGVWSADENDVIVYVNRDMEKIAGARKEAIIGKNVLRGFSEGTIKFFRPYYLKAKRKLKPVFYSEILVVTPAKRVSYQSGWLVPHIRNGKFDGMTCTIEDVTNRKRALEKIRESEIKFKNFFNDNPAYCYIISPQRIIVDVNKAALVALKYKKNELVGRDFLTVYPRNQHIKIKKIFTKQKNIRYIKNVELIVLSKNGEEKHVLLSANALNLGEKKPYFLSVQIDITARKEAEKALKETNEYLEERVEERTKELEEIYKKLSETEKLASLGKMASTIAHELRNPMGVVRLAVYTLKKKIGDNKELINHLNNIDKKIVESDKIIHDLLVFSRATEPEFKIGHIKESIESALEMAEGHAKTDNIKITKRIASDIPKMRADFIQLSEVFSNLFSNAIDAMKDSPKKELKISAKKLENLIEIKIRDTGEGISKENLKKLGEPFFSTKTKGIGLGLYIAYEIIRRHKGRVKVESKVKAGTSFIIRLPIIKT